MNKARLTSIACLTALATSFAVAAQDTKVRPYNEKPNTVRLRFGSFELDGGSRYWYTRERDFFGGVDDFDDDRWGVDYIRMLNERWGALVSASSFEGRQTTAFRDFVDDFGNDIFHTTTLEITDLSGGLLLFPWRRNRIVAPYIGAGLGYYAYDLAEDGDFIDFDTFDIFSGRFTSSGETIGWFWLVGLEVPITGGFSVFGEYRWHDVDTELRDDFRDFGILDMGGDEASLGVSFRF